MDKPLRILHLEDDPDYSELVKTMLQGEGMPVEMTLVDNAAAFAAALERQPFDVILGDYKLPTCTGIQALETAKKKCPGTPFLLVSGTIGEQAAIESLRNGATDYVLKHWPERLVPAVRRAVQETQERTQRQRVETELIRREKYFRALTENSLDVLSILNREGVFQYNSPSVKHVLGYEPQELAGRNAFELVHPDDLSGAMQALERALKDPELRVTHECRCRRRDGSWCHLEVVGQNRLNDPEIAGVVLNSRDITKRKRAEEALRERQSKLDSIFRAAPVGIGVSANRVFTEVNDTLCQMVGYTAEELIGQSARIIYATQEDFDFVGREIYGHIAERAVNCLESRLRCKDGRGIDVLLSASAVVPGNPAAGVTFVVMDITERKRVEQHLRLQSAALESAANVIVITDRDGNVTWANPAFSRATGYTLEEVMGQNPRVLKSGKHDQAFYRNLWETILAGRVWQAEMVNRRKDGSLFTEEATITPVRDERGEITHFIAVKQDITARKELESQLRQAQKMEAIGQLAGGVAHDFNNILTVIHGHASLLLAGEGLASAGVKSVQQIVQAAERAAGLTRQLLTFSRRQIMQTRLVDMNEVVSNMTKMLGRILGEDITLQMSYSPNHPQVQADAGMMEQVLMNLAINSRDAMPKGGQLSIKISMNNVDPHHVALHPEARVGRFVCLDVADNGCGIAPEHLGRIFEPFFTTKDVGKGTGLGLATVYGIVQQHHGWIEVESEPGKGATFRVFLPASLEPPASPGARVVEKPVRGGTETILVVEDEAPVRNLVCGCLAGRGYAVLHAESGVEALEIWRQHKGKINLVLTDLVMPDQMSGWELAETLWADQPDLKIIFTTGYATDVAGKEFVLQREKNFLPKPYDPKTLASMVRECLDAQAGP